MVNSMGKVELAICFGQFEATVGVRCRMHVAVRAYASKTPTMSACTWNLGVKTGRYSSDTRSQYAKNVNDCAKRHFDERQNMWKNIEE